MVPADSALKVEMVKVPDPLGLVVIHSIQPASDQVTFTPQHGIPLLDPTKVQPAQLQVIVELLVKPLPLTIY
jgi:hypothetical protein